jgi:general secretion pathway protein F/type IV pilus assembly protein PilC
LRSLEAIEKQASHAGLKAVLAEVHRRVEDGSTLADAMGRYQPVFGEMAVHMVHAGGEGGFLEEALSRVAEFTETQDDLRKRTLGAVAYPAFLAAVGTVVVTVLVVFFVPKFSELFARLRERGELPLLTEWLLATSVWLRHWGLLVLAAAVAGGWWTRRWLQSDAGRWWRDRLVIRLPLAGPIYLGLAVARFCRVLGTLLHNGVPILRSLEISRDATGNRVLAAAIGEATKDISAGQPLAGPLGASGQFPPLVVEMIAVAEQANNLEQVLLDVAGGLERRTWRRLELAVRLIEPILLLVLAVVVLVLVIALLLPVLKMSSTV